MRHLFSKKLSSYRANNFSRGALLIEILVTISILAVILSLGAQSSFVSLRASKSAGEKDVALNLAIETMEAVRSASDEKWQNLYDLTKGSANHYYPSQSSGKWVINNSGDQALTVNGIQYARYFVAQNVCRGTDSSRNITGITDSDGSVTACSTNGGSLDPSTQKATVTVTTNWATSTAITFSQYFSRWRNRVCDQTSWTGGKTYPTDPAPLSACTTLINTYYNDDGNINFTGGVIQLQ